MVGTVASATPTTTDLLRRIVPGRRIEGISAVLLPFTAGGRIDADGFAGHLERTVVAGLRPAVNMDTGYVNLLSPAERRRVLGITRDVLAGRPFVAGAFDEGEAGDPLDRYLRAVEEVQSYGGTPILF